MARSLYICYFGVDQPLVQTQVIPYLRELVKGGHELTLLTFEPGQVDEHVIRENLAADGIKWHWLRYHKRPSVPATMFDIANGARFIAGRMRQESFDILHARSHVPMMMAALARKYSRLNPRLLFDIRGFMPEEYVDAGIWPEGGSVYRAVKKAEAWIMKEASGFVVLTEKAREILADQIGGRPVEVIPCCVDLHRFEAANKDSRQEIRVKLEIGDRYTVAYVGAFGGWYLTEETAEFFGTLKMQFPDSFALVLTQSDPGIIRPLFVSRGLDEGDFFIGRVASADIPKYLSGADGAISLIKNCYSKQASSPTKNAEYLACGLPIVANSGIGDTDRHINEDGVGVLVDDLTGNGYLQAIKALRSLGPDTSDKCRSSARNRFDLVGVGGTRYRRLYDSLMGSATSSE